MMLEALRTEVHRQLLELPKNNLVVWTEGNVSARDAESDYVVIKPSGIKYEELSPGHMVIVDLKGNLIEGGLKPSSDTKSHLYIYRHMPKVYGVVHTHSPYATAFAALGKPIPVCLTSMADEFGTSIPVGGFALIGDEEIGKVVVGNIGDCPAVLLRNHGVFTVGPSVDAAVRSAVMVEDAAKITSIALQMGVPEEIDPEDVTKLHERYTRIYGQ